jgi:opacity protein-like surface antigen
MRKVLLAATCLSLLAGAAVAQTAPANPSPTTPAVNTPGSTSQQAPVPGANSFTEGQAKSRIEAQGYSDVSDLKKDDQGVWRGKAKKDGRVVNVSLDFQGNVTATPAS